MKRIAWLVCCALLAGSALWGQGAAPATGDAGTAGTAQGSGSPAATPGAPAAAAGAAAATAGSGEDEFFGSGERGGQARGRGKAECRRGRSNRRSSAFPASFRRLSSYTMTRNFIQGNTGFSDNTFANTIMGDFLVDARLPQELSDVHGPEHQLRAHGSARAGYRNGHLAVPGTAFGIPEPDHPPGH